MLFTEKYSKQISGVLHCYDRVIIQGTVPGICYARGMTSYLYSNKIRIFDYPKFAAPFKDELRNNAEKIASDNGIEIQFIPKRNIRKEKVIKNIKFVSTNIKKLKKTCFIYIDCITFD